MRLLLSAIVCISLIHAQAQHPVRYSVIVDEVFPDPEPSKGLPNASFIELRNLSGDTIDLKGWMIQVNTTSLKINVSKVLFPDSLVILCSGSSAGAYRPYGDVLALTGFPALPDAAGTIALYAPDRRTIHAIEYDRKDHANAWKQQGGWSLEMIDVSHSCMMQGNWTSSVDPVGGTPGRVNSVSGHADAEGPPHALRSWAKDSLHINVLFDRAMDSLSASNITSYDISDGTRISGIALTPPLFRMAVLSLAQPLKGGKTLDLHVHDIVDCSGEVMTGPDSMHAGLPVGAPLGSIVINELLFDPKPEGTDFVELLNTGTALLDASTLSIGKRDAQGHVSGLVNCSPVPFLFSPGDHYTMASDPGIIRNTFLVRHPEWQSPPMSLPSLPNDEGDIVVVNDKGDILDEVHYQASWHFPLLDDVEGVSLERIDPKGPSQDPSNWHSAAVTAGGGTPTDRNSQRRDLAGNAGNWSVTPEVFSPDMDGHDDVLTISYMFPVPGWSIDVTIYDREGRPVRRLCRHLLCGHGGSLRWDGLDDQGRHPGHGAYIMVAEGIDLNGGHTLWRKRISMTGTRR